MIKKRHGRREFKNQPRKKLVRVATEQAKEILRLRRQLREMLDDAEYEQMILQIEAKHHRTHVALEEISSPPKPRDPQPGHGPTEQTELEVVERVYKLDDADKVCPTCGGELFEWDGQFEESELIDIVQRAIIREKVKRQKYRCECKDCGHIDTALGPVKTIPGGRYSLDFAIEVAEQKYLDHMPLERIARQMDRQGLKVKSQTLWDQIEALAGLLEHNWNALRDYNLEQPVVGLDATGWPKLSKKRSKPWQMWCLTSETAVFHTIREDKSAETCLDILGDFEGVVVCDQASTHHKAARAGPGWKIAGCWAHIYRKFREASDDFPTESERVMEMISKLYAHDRAAEDFGRTVAQMRDVESRAKLAELHEYLSALPVLTSTSLGKAVKHTLDYWTTLRVFVDDERIWLDNNLTERSLRGPVVGRKNHYGSKSQRGTEVAAIFYSLMETAKLVGVNPAFYLREASRRAIENPHIVFLPHDI